MQSRLRKSLTLAIGLAFAAVLLAPQGASGSACSTAQCQTLKANANMCGTEAPFGCLDDTQKGCYKTAADAQAHCLKSDLWCDASGCGPVWNPPAVPAKDIGKCSAALCGQWGAMPKNPHNCRPGYEYTCTDASAGCYQKSNLPTTTTCAEVCDVSDCWWYAGAAKYQRPTRTLHVVNNCDVDLDIYWTEGLTLAEAKAVNKDESTTHFSWLTVKANSKTSKAFDHLSEATNSYGQKYYSYGGSKQLGVNFWAMPPDGDTANTTLFEINFSANGGAADYYDISAIPPGSCAGHVNPDDNDYGYADHLPFKDAADQWACLHYTSGADKGKVIPGTCGDGLGAVMCPAVAGTVQPPQAVQGEHTGCGVGKCCKTFENGTCTDPSDASGCCPNVCAAEESMETIEKLMKTDPKKVYAIRNKVYACASAQAKQVAKDLKITVKKTGKPPRQTGFYKGLAVEPVKHEPDQDLGTCPARKCTAGANNDDFSNMGETCEGYLWPYDDAFGLIRCVATPDYKLTFCP